MDRHLIELDGIVRDLFRTGALWEKKSGDERTQGLRILEAGVEAVSKSRWFGDKSALIIPARYGLQGQVSFILDEHGCYAYRGKESDNEQLQKAALAFAKYYALIRQSKHGASRAVRDLTHFNHDSYVHVVVDEQGGVNLMYPKRNLELDRDHLSRLKLDREPDHALPGLVKSQSGEPIHFKYPNNSIFKEITEAWAGDELRQSLTENFDEVLALFQSLTGPDDQPAKGSGYAMACLGKLGKDSGLRHIYYCPSVLSYVGTLEGSPPAVMVVCTWEPLSESEVRAFEGFSTIIWGAITSLELRAQRERARLSAKQAATSTNLTRTLSHNTGSHSLNALGSDEKLDAAFKRIEECIAKKPLPGAVYKNAEGTKPDNAVNSTPFNKDMSQQRRVWLGIYNNYLRERMDLLADITTAIPMYETSKALVQDVLRGFERNYLLTTTIAGANEFDYRFAYTLPYGQDDINAAIPGDALGLQCCWLILENMIRNSAKHGAHPAGEPVVYSVNVAVHTNNDYLRVRITEKHPKRTAASAAKLAEARNTDIDKEVLDENDQVRQTALGMLEMKAACAYLRKVGMDEIDDVDYRTQAPLPLLKAISGDDGEFGYQFFLRQTKGVLHVESDEVIRSLPLAGTADDDSPRALGKFLNAGVCDHPLLLIKLEDAKSLGDLISALLTDINAFPHEMLLCSSLIPTQQALDEMIDTAAVDLGVNNKLTAALAHSASILKRSLYLIGHGEYESMLPLADEDRLLNGRRIWLSHRMSSELEQIPFGLNTHLHTDELRKYQSPNAEHGIRVDYAPHSGSKKFEEVLSEFLKPEADPPSGSSPINLSDRLRDLFRQGHRRAYVLRFPSSVEHVMSTQNQSMPPVRGALLTQTHVAYWIKATAVIDERIQQAAQTDTYSLGSQGGKHGQPDIIGIERLLAAANVFTPPTTINLQQNTFTDELWTKLLEWLGKLGPMLSYTYVHLGVLEKFSAALKPSVSELIDQIKEVLPRVRIIVISGRGKPHNLPDGELFVNYSAASQYLAQTYTRAPVLLSALSHSARRLKH